MTMKRLSVYSMAVIAVFTAMTCILAPLSIPIGAVPISLTAVVLYISTIVLGWKYALISYVIYLLIGIAGVPVFSGYGSGIAKLTGPTGGYLVGYILNIAISGLIYEKLSLPAKARKGFFYGTAAIGFLIGLAATYGFGTAWFVFSLQSTWEYALPVCVYPFLPFDLLKIVLALAVAPVISARLDAAGLKVDLS